MKRILTLLLTLAMTLSLAMPAQAANNTQASTMRLMETEGTATVENAIGKKLTIQDKMRLYNGYEVSTQKASYAYISLDSSKAVKLDASSSVTVNQSGKKLELDVTAGELFFNVPVALKSDESLKIRSSTMVTGIRGTAGWVNAMDRYTTRIGVLEGAVTIQSQDPFTGANRSVTIVGGQIATIIRHERANAIQQQLINDGVIIEENIVSELTKPGQIVEELQEDDVPGFVAAEVAKDDELRNRINEESPLDADEIANNADDRLLADQMAADKNDPETNDYNKDQESIFGEPEIIYVTVTKPGAPVQDPILDTEDPDVDEIQESLDELDVATVTNVDDLDLSELDFDKDDVLNIVSGTAIVGSGSAADIAGTVNVFADATLTNSGTITITSTDSLHIYGTVINNGEIVLGGGDENGTSLPGKLVVEERGLIENRGEISLTHPNSSFVIKGDYSDYVNEVVSLNSNDEVIYLGSFDQVLAASDNFSGLTFKVLNTGYLTMDDMWYCGADDKIILDMNGNTASLRCLIPEEYGGGTENAFYMVITSGTPDDCINLTLTDSVGGGNLTGNLYINSFFALALKSGTLSGIVEVTDNAFFEMNGGTLNGFVDVYNYYSSDSFQTCFEMNGGTIVVPEYTCGVYTTETYFYMTGGTIDASNTGACALNLDLSCNEDGSPLYFSHSETLQGGILVGRELFSNGVYYEIISINNGSGDSYNIKPQNNSSAYGPTEIPTNDFGFICLLFKENTSTNFYEPQEPYILYTKIGSSLYYTNLASIIFPNYT